MEVRMRRRSFLILAGSVLVAPRAGSSAQAPPDPGRIFPPEARLERLVQGCEFTEGPAVDANGDIYFSDAPTNRVLVYTTEGLCRVWERTARGSRGANGMLFDRQGRLVTCNSQLAPDGRSVTRYESDGRVTILAERYQGRRLNSPNDLAIDNTGRIYFTDPRYGETADLEQDRMAVYRIERDGKLTRVIDDVQVPNGIAITPDNRTLYVADNNPAPGGARTLVGYDIQANGRVRRRSVLHDFGAGRGIDGMALDVEGNVYGTAGEKEKTGVYVFSPRGDVLAFLPTPETATNCTFGGPDLKTLYITAGGSLYRIQPRVAGSVVFPRPAG
jgi:gluconolactonase